MANEKRLIDANTLLKVLKHRVKGNEDSGIVLGTNSTLGVMEEWVRSIPTVDAVEVVHGHKIGDVCFYGFHDGNKSLALVEIVKVLNSERGVAEVKFLKVFVDDTGNGLFNYLLKTNQTMNASFKYLKNITPTGAKMDGGNDNG